MDLRQAVKQMDRTLGMLLCGLVGRLRRRTGGAEDAVPRDRLRRILVIKLVALGDAVLAVPALRALRTEFPHARIVMVGSSISRPVVENCPYLDEVRTINLEEAPLKPTKTWRFLHRLRAERFDLVLDLDQWMRATSLMTWLTGAPIRAGFDTVGQGRGSVYTHAFRPPRDRHERDNFLSLVESVIGHPIADRAPELWPSEQDITWAKQLTSDGRPWISMHPGCGADGGRREWPAERYSQLGDLAARSLSARVLITGGRSEAALAQQVADGMKESSLMLAGGLSFSQLAALLKQCKVLVCGNTGVMHVAAAVGTPTVSLHGPTNVRKWGPVGPRHRVITSSLDCSPCLELGFEYGCDEAPCMRTIEVEEVFEAVKDILTSEPRQA